MSVSHKKPWTYNNSNKKVAVILQDSPTFLRMVLMADSVRVQHGFDNCPAESMCRVCRDGSIIIGIDTKTIPIILVTRVISPRSKSVSIV